MLTNNLGTSIVFISFHHSYIVHVTLFQSGDSASLDTWAGRYHQVSDTHEPLTIDWMESAAAQSRSLNRCFHGDGGLWYQLFDWANNDSVTLICKRICFSEFIYFVRFTLRMFNMFTTDETRTKAYFDLYQAYNWFGWSHEV